MMQNLGEWRQLGYSEAALKILFEETGGHPFIARQVGSEILKNTHEFPAIVEPVQMRESIERFAQARTDYWDLLWRQLLEPEREVLKQIARQGAETADTLLVELEKMWPQKAISQAIQDLESYGIIAQREGRYHIVFGLLQRAIIAELLT